MKILNNKEFLKLKEFLKTCELDPTFLNYGGFIREVKNISYHKDYRDTINKFLGYYKIWFSSQMYQFDKENGYNLLVTKEQSEEVKKILQKRQTEKIYIDWFNSLFNCYTYEYTIYSDDLPKKLYSGDWWITVKDGKYINLDSDKKTDENLKKEVTKECLKRIEILKSKGIKINGYEVRKEYKNINLSNEEFLWFKTNIVDRQGHPTHQITRRLKEDVKHRINDFKEYVLEPTKRKALISIENYGLTYIEIEKPILTP